MRLLMVLTVRKFSSCQWQLTFAWLTIFAYSLEISTGKFCQKQSFSFVDVDYQKIVRIITKSIWLRTWWAFMSFHKSTFIFPALFPLSTRTPPHFWSLLQVSPSRTAFFKIPVIQPTKTCLQVAKATPEYFNPPDETPTEVDTVPQINRNDLTKSCHCLGS